MCPRPFHSHLTVLPLSLSPCPVRVSVEALVGEMREHLHDGRRGERLRSGVHVAILGAPNAGKSSLLNILCEKQTADMLMQQSWFT